MYQGTVKEPSLADLTEMLLNYCQKTSGNPVELMPWEDEVDFTCV